MRHLYLTLQHTSVVEALLTGDLAAVRRPFQRLLHPECIDWLLADGAGAVSQYEANELIPARAKLPFVPGLGRLRITDKAQVEHRGIHHSRGYATTPQGVPSSPTGMRLVPRTYEMVSRYRLADTYHGERNAEASRRIATEGTTDYLVSEDQSIWHIAVSVEPRHRVTVEATNSEAAKALDGVEVSVRPYIHVYPHGGLTVTLGMSLVFAEDASVDRLIGVIRTLVRRLGSPGVVYRMRGVEGGTAHSFVKQLINQTTEAIAPEGRAADSVHLDYAISLGASSDELSDVALSGLLTLDDRYRVLKPEWVEARASLYGKYGGDRVLASQTSLAVTTDPGIFSPSGRRRFFWRCHAINEFATVQARVLYYLNHRLSMVGTLDGPDEATTGRLLAIGEHLVDLPRGLPAHHRKWFYECQRLAHGVRAADRFFAVLGNLHHDAQHAAMMRRMDESRSVKIVLNNSQVGALNLGTVVGNVETHLTALRAGEGSDVQEDLRILAQAVLDDEHLTDDDRQELLESIDLLAEEAGRARPHQRTSVVRAVLTDLGGIGESRKRPV
ncbi:MAG TPA: hypothetical protein VKB25_07920 [Conexibacter sp.]|nr:hypothetical protein [Conexibacter sp.]